MGWWATSVVIIHAIRAPGNQRLRSLADRPGLSKSSVHRPLQALARRDCAPESSWWDTPAGRPGRIRLVVAPLWVGGLNRGVGAEPRSELFRRLGLEAPVGCSPRALRPGRHTLARRLLETAGAWEKAGLANGESRPVIGAVEETVVQRRLLGFLDLATGDGVREEGAADRRFAPWCARANERLTTCGPTGGSRVRARAQALMTLAAPGLRCPSLPEVLPRGQALAHGDALCRFGRLRPANRDREPAKQGREKLPQSAPGDPPQVVQAQGRGTACVPSGPPWQAGGRAGRQPRSKVSHLLPPWRLLDARRPTSQAVEPQGRAELQASATVRETNGLPKKQAPGDTGRKPRAGLSALVALWGPTGRQDWTQMAMTPRRPPGAEDG
jgi:hypothetical protein